MPLDEIEAAYYVDRFLLDGEVNDILLYESSNRNVIEIIISSPFLRRILEDSEILNAISSSNAMTISLFHNTDEYGVAKSIEYFQRLLPKSKKLEVYPMKGADRVHKDSFVLYPYLAIETVYSPIVTNSENRTLARKNSTVHFEKGIVAQKYQSHSRTKQNGVSEK